MFRKRYTVVIIGGATGSSAAQRSEVSRHRSERDAQIAAQYERTRLGGLHGDGTGQYRVIVEREGEVVSTGPISDLTELPFTITAEDVPPGLEEDVERVTDPGRTHAVIRPAAAEPTPAEAGPADTEPAEAASAEPAPVDIAGASPGPEDAIPEGPVPEDILRRFEESIAREQERRSAHLPHEE